MLNEQWRMYQVARQPVCGTGFLTSSTHAAWVWAMLLDQMYTSTVNTLKISITFQNQHTTVAGRALIDSGAMENFINYRMVVWWRLQTKNLWCPRKVYNVDGTKNQGGIIDKSCVLHVQWGEQQVTQRFYVTNLGQDHVILGYPWLQEFNPDVNWEEGRLVGEEVKLEEIGVAWMNYREQWTEIGKTHFAQDWAIQGREQRQQGSVEARGIPDEYQCHCKVFSDQQATRFPPSRPEDHAIKLIPGAPETINCKVYPLTLCHAFFVYYTVWQEDWTADWYLPFITYDTMTKCDVAA
jgi:hypothetical protein